MKRGFSFGALACPARAALLAACALSLIACGPARSRVPFSCNPDAFGDSIPGRLRLRALSAPAKTGVLEGASASAWFSLHSRLSGSGLFPRVDDPAGPRALEVHLLNETAEPVSVSLAPVYASDICRTGGLAGQLRPRHLSEARGIVGRFRLRMILSSPDEVIAGFAVQLSGTQSSRVRIESASIERAETGWQRAAGESWAGFGPDGGTVDAALSGSPSVEVPAHAALELSFGPTASDGMGTSIRPERSVFSSGGTHFGFRVSPAPHRAYIPGFMPAVANGTVVPPRGDSRLSGMRAVWHAADSASTGAPATTEGRGPGSDDRLSPIPADPFMMLEWPQSKWRNPDREVFSWDRFPSILIFDTANYAVQDRLFKRLAFFVEKGGYRGRLLTDGEMEGMHAFNAHDYRAESLAAFFETARSEGFALNPEELELRGVLLDSGILLKSGGSFREGAGAVLSVSRESVEYLRYLFVNHEGLHGLYFTDPGFRDEVSRVYRSMDGRAIGFLQGYFSIIDSLDYDVNDSYLMENEFMAYVMQQPVDRVEAYFSGNLLERFTRHGGQAELASYMEDTKGSEFVRAAAELDAYVFSRWGLSSGRVGLWFSY